MEQLIGRIERAVEALARERARVEAGEPWPLSERFDHAPEASWGPPELLAHVSEMLPFWLGEVERVIAGAAEPVPFGRVGDDPVRIAIIARDRSLPVGELYARISQGVVRWTERLSTLTPTEQAKRGLHPTRGEMSVGAIVEGQIAGHLEEHAAQLATILDARARQR
ncbi:MAG TPA: DinB family protein [Candidatus Limnocylindrales bacterium]|jgi:hypothetical protein|nr:DinB family protein [Candidatus Limnocylindrales bacterium]